MECFKCDKSSADGRTLYRQNEKGVPGIWACAVHSKPVDDELVQIVAAVQKGIIPSIAQVLRSTE